MYGVGARRDGVNRNPQGVLGITGVLALIIAVPHTLHADAALVKRFRSEYPAASQAVKDFYTGVSMRVTETSTWTTETGQARYEHTLKTSGQNVLLRTETIEEPAGWPKGNATRAIVANTNLSFVVTQPQAKGPWQLDDISEYLPSKQSPTLYARGVVAPYTFNTTDLSEMISRKDFRITAAEYVERNGRKLARIEFDRSNDNYNTTGWIELSPDESWIINEYSLHSADKPNSKNPNPTSGDLHVTISYQESGEKLPWLHEVEFVTIARDRRGSVTLDGKNVYRVTEIERTATPSNEFKLAAFGIEEPNHTPNQARRTWMILVIGGVFLTAFCVFWLSRRRTTSG